jgi:ubiquinone/menaquinone biosynthesis C-methylase UbiE
LTEKHVTPGRDVYYSNCFLTRKLFEDRLKFAASFVSISNESVILDVGCNDGRFLKIIQTLNNSCNCWGIDLRSTVDKIKINNCKFRVADVRKLPFDDNYFDIVFALDMLEHVENVEIGIKEIHRVLKPGGFAILSGPTENWFYKLCRIIQFRVIDRDMEIGSIGLKGEVDFHLYSVFELEKKFKKSGFNESKRKSLPGFPFPDLFRITKFQK